MNRKIASALTIIATTSAAIGLAAIASSRAYADDITIDNQPFVSTRARAEVQAELLRSPELVRASASEWSSQLNQLPQVRSTYTSEQAQQDYKTSRPLVNALNAEDSGSAYFLKSPSPHGANPSAVMGAPAR